ncbi:MAG TPA: PilZ domain-containing protein [Smithella sp.]|nr:PilZ domain-containing protein [Smithella sp.]MDM7988819.1 PilZ domain-containing protein [Smithella sp.]HNY51100.1 PilZ domain-containing protein [Smithella sp.]HOG91592.1 PilZ domain-containing protein [Smithella sp.]HOU50342.1 PilZ domain-containing protein [Smithella sp.]
MVERRKAPRLKEESDVTITVVSDGKNQKVVYDSSKDISVYGAKLHSREMFPINTLLEIDFTSKAVQEKITALGKVKWIKVIIEDASYEMGVEFVKTPGDAMKKLEDYISWKQKRTNPNPFGDPD